MNNVIRVVNILLSLIAIYLSACALSSRCCINIPEMVLSIVGISTALIVGIKVFDVVESYIERRRIEKKIKMLTEHTKRLEKIEKKVCSLREQSNILFHHTWGLAFIKIDPYIALNEFMEAFCLSIKRSETRRAYSCLCNAEDVLENIKQNCMREKNDIKKINITSEISEEIRKADIYEVHGQRIENLLKGIRELNACIDSQQQSCENKC